jgi:hypothetical protein
MYLSSQNVAVAADQFKKQLDTGLLNKMGKIKIYDAGEFNANSYGGGYDRSKRKYKGIDRKYV